VIGWEGGDTHGPKGSRGAPVLVGDEVRAALATGAAVVALESTLLAHGLPFPENEHLARELDAIIRGVGAVPATVAVDRGRPVVGLDEAGLARLVRSQSVAKLSVRDLPLAMAHGIDGATTVASTASLAAAVGVGVFATGGLGGVHRGARETYDESADLVTLSNTPLTVVCAGVKSLLDITATVERLESLNVAVAGYRTDRFPGFYRRDGGVALDWTLETPEAVALAMRARDDLRAAGAPGAGGALVLVNPLPPDAQLNEALHDTALASGLAEAERLGIKGKAVTPFLLAHFHRVTAGESLRVNLDIVRRNARLAAEVAVARARLHE
jgi:pseudouridine-5'-phosphate glycosidase